MKKRINLVLAGGGMKGIGLIGAVSALENDFEFHRMAGASAGAIVASLLAAGYDAAELRGVIGDTDFSKFKHKNLLDNFGKVGASLGVIVNYGIYSSDYFENWLSALLAKKGVHTFGDLKTEDGYKFRAVASDITAESILILPDDIAAFGINPDCLNVAHAVRMSMSIPFYFEPVKISDCYNTEHIIVDGGLLSNYPMWLFHKSDIETIGIKFKEYRKCEYEDARKINNFADYLKHMADTMMDFFDKEYIKLHEDLKNTIFVPTDVMIKSRSYNIRTTRFEITQEEKDALYENGRKAALEYMKR